MVSRSYRHRTYNLVALFCRPTSTDPQRSIPGHCSRLQVPETFLQIWRRRGNFEAGSVGEDRLILVPCPAAVDFYERWK